MKTNLNILLVSALLLVAAGAFAATDGNDEEPITFWNDFDEQGALTNIPPMPTCEEDMADCREFATLQREMDRNLARFQYDVVITDKECPVMEPGLESLPESVQYVFSLSENS